MGSHRAATTVTAGQLGTEPRLSRQHEASPAPTAEGEGGTGGLEHLCRSRPVTPHSNRPCSLQSNSTLDEDGPGPPGEAAAALHLLPELRAAAPMALRPIPGSLSRAGSL